MSPGRLLERWRSWTPSPTALRRAFLATLATNAGIVVTGGAVRLTASGLGCPTFPRCTDQSLVVTRETGGHGLIEFGNRTLTFVLTAAVVVAVVVAWRAGRADLRRLALLLLAGIAAQALWGGIVVLTELNPVWVLTHFLLSMVIIAVAVYAYELAGGVRVPEQRVVHPTVLLGGRSLVAATAALLVVGTVVTGTGPHSGDPEATDRLPFDLLEVTQLHADLVFLVGGLALGLTVALYAVEAPGGLRRRAVTLIGVLIGQGAVGYLQYWTDLPVGLVVVHLLGACLVWIASLRLLLGMTTRVARFAPGPDHEQLPATTTAT